MVSFTSRSKETHNKTVHDGKRVFKCDICIANFNLKDILKLFKDNSGQGCLLGLILSNVDIKKSKKMYIDYVW